MSDQPLPQTYESRHLKIFDLFNFVLAESVLCDLYKLRGIIGVKHCCMYITWRLALIYVRKHVTLLGTATSVSPMIIIIIRPDPHNNYLVLN